MVEGESELQPGGRARIRLTICWGLLSAIGVCSAAALGMSSAQAQERDGLKWSWVKTPDCPPRSCWQVKVTAQATSCPHGLYLALNQWTQTDMASPTNTFLSDVSAVLPHLRRNETAIVTLPRTARTAKAISISEINCY